MSLHLPGALPESVRSIKAFTNGPPKVTFLYRGTSLQGPYVILTIPGAVKVGSIVPWIHNTRVKRAYHTDSENAECTAQSDPIDPRETKTILKKKKKKIPDEPLWDEATQSTPAAWPHQRDFEFNFHFNSGQCFHLMGTFLCRLPQHFQLLGMWGYPLSVMDGLPWWVSPLCQGYLNHSALSWDDKKRFSPLLSIITSPCSLGYLQSVDSGHGLTFDKNASVAKA